MSRATVFQYRAGVSVFHRLDPMTKFAWLLSVSLLAFGAYIAWIQILIALIVLGTASLLAGSRRPKSGAAHGCSWPPA